MKLVYEQVPPALAIFCNLYAPRILLVQSKASAVIQYLFYFLARIVAKNIGWEVNRPFMKIIAQQFLGGLGPLHPANRGAAAPRAPLLPTAMPYMMSFLAFFPFFKALGLVFFYGLELVFKVSFRVMNRFSIRINNVMSVWQLATTVASILAWYSQFVAGS